MLLKNETKFTLNDYKKVNKKIDRYTENLVSKEILRNENSQINRVSQEFFWIFKGLSIKIKFIGYFHLTEIIAKNYTEFKKFEEDVFKNEKYFNLLQIND